MTPWTSASAASARKNRAVLAWCSLASVVLFYVITIVRMGER